MRNTKDFVAAIQQQGEFDPDEGNIVELTYIRRFRDEEGKMLASKYAHFRAFHQRKPIIRDDGTKDYSDVFWALPDDCVFAMCGEAIVTFGAEEFPPKGASDEITLNYGCVHMSVVDVWQYSETDRGTFFRFVVGNYEPFPNGQGAVNHLPSTIYPHFHGGKEIFHANR